MSEFSGVKRLLAGRAEVEVHADARSAGEAAAQRAALVINDAIERRGEARIIVATGNSQVPLVEALRRCDVNWSAVDVFHMDEYVGLSANHPASFRRWIRERIDETLHPRRVEYLQGDAAELETEIARYTRLLHQAPIDVAFVGFGENGHIAFNDPHEADFEDKETIKIAHLDEPCRLQQVGEGHFAGLSDVPATALTITCPGLFAAAHWVCSVPEKRKARAVECALEGPVTTACPASLVQRHACAFVYLDVESASLLKR